MEMDADYAEISQVKTAIVDAVESRDADGLLAVLRSHKKLGERLRRGWDNPVYIAAKAGDVRCLRVFHECGFEMDSGVWRSAAEHGHVDCLAFAVSHGYVLDVLALFNAVCNGHQDCVKLMLQQGLPRGLFMLDERRVTPQNSKCVKLLREWGVAVGPENLLMAAKRGDMATIRLLHKRGVPLWRQACEKRTLCSLGFFDELQIALGEIPETLAAPFRPGEMERMWEALLYGSLYGAPIPCSVQNFLNKKRQQTRAMLMCSKPRID